MGETGFVMLDVAYQISLIDLPIFDLVLPLVVLLVADRICLDDAPVLPNRVGRLVVLDIPD